MKLSLVFELLLIFVLIAFAASKNINKRKNNNKGLRNKDDDIKIEESSLNRYCKCSESLCNCCRDFAVPVVNLNGPGCASLMYLTGDKMSISLSFGKKVITNRTVASRKPSPVCMPLPGGVSKFCGRVYNIARTGEDFRACLGLELQAKSTVEAAVRVSCFKFGPRGVTSEPADPLPLVPQEETETEDDDDDDDDDEDDFGLGADDDDDEVEDDDDDDDGEIDAVNDVDTADYTGFSLLGEDLLGDLFGSSGGKKPNKNRNKQAPTSSTSTTTRRPRPNRRTTRRPNTRTTPRPVTRTTTVRVRPINRRPTRRPGRRPTRRPTAGTTSADSFPESSISTASDSISASSEMQDSHTSTTVGVQSSPASMENIEMNDKIVPINDKTPLTIAATTPITATSFEDSGLEMSLAHITGQLSVMPVTQIIPTLSKEETKSSEEQTYEKVQTITPKPHSTIPFATVVDDDEVKEDMVQIVQSLDSHSAEHEADKEGDVDESRGHNHFPNHHYEGLVLPKKKHRGEQFDLEDLDVLDLTKIGESVGHQLGIFGRHKRQNKNKDNKTHKHKKQHNNDYGDVLGIDALNESLGLPDIEVGRRRSSRRQNKMMRGEWSQK
ncbi:uncharacterized protein LOC119829753 [Zerene cesonia]|uniref:uncharacterized protein LOC119829753 n=1 Tax=Zerene cesonia TaxID=33412 RepID=UPI0018E55D87|nr:uncharacterized protein LOC119829753 [Zerene cesonia]